MLEVINGRMAATKPNELKINSTKANRPATINGIMPLEVNINGYTRMPVPSGCVLYAPFYHSALSPTVSKSLDANAHTITRVGTLWTPQGGKFDRSDDYINLGNNAVLDFTAGNFTIFFRIKPAVVDASIQMYYCKGRDNVDGVIIYDEGGGMMRITTSQGGAKQNTRSLTGAITAGVWQSWAFSRNGATIKCYKNTTEIAYNTVGVHINPASAAARNALYGINYDLTTVPISGTTMELLILNAASTPALIKQIDQATSWRCI